MQTGTEDSIWYWVELLGTRAKEKLNEGELGGGQEREVGHTFGEAKSGKWEATSKLKTPYQKQKQWLKNTNPVMWEHVGASRKKEKKKSS